VLLAPTPELAARLRAYVRRRVADPHLAEDLAQEVLLRVHQRAGGLRDPAAIEGWAYRVAHNTIVDHGRRAVPEVPVDATLLDPADERTGEPHDDAVREHLIRCVPRFVAELSSADREALELCDLGDLTQAQAAARLGLTVPGMKARVQRARRRLREALASCCEVVLDARNRPIAYEPGPDCRCGASPT
jgi:RNA polymerase sigma-70 factor (ECF subfamily)